MSEIKTIIMKKVSLLMLAVALLAMASCKSSPKTEERLSNIDGVLQDSVEAILERHLGEYDAMDGVAIVMETESGKIRSMVGLMAKSDSSYERADSLAASKHSSALMRTISVLAALNTGPDKKDFFASVRDMSFGQPLEIEGLKVDSCSQDTDLSWYYYAMGFQETAPIQMLAFYNAIARKDKIASPSSIADIRGMLEGVVKEGFGKQAMSDKFEVAGMNGTIYNKDSTLTADFCGYFPADKPKYTILVSVRRKEIPAAGGRMAGTIFKEIAESIVSNQVLWRHY